MTNKVLIVGGGPAGLAAARTLLDEHMEVVLVEKEESLGGMARAGNQSYQGSFFAMPSQFVGHPGSQFFVWLQYGLQPFGNGPFIIVQGGNPIVQNA